MRKEMLRQIKLFNIVQLTSDKFKMQTGFSVMEYHHVPTEPWCLLSAVIQALNI